MSKEFENDLSITFKGLMRGYAKEKETIGGRLAEGTDPMTFSLNKLLCMMNDCMRHISHTLGSPASTNVGEYIIFFYLSLNSSDLS